MPRFWILPCLLAFAMLAVVACDDGTSTSDNTPVSTQPPSTPDPNVSPSPTALVQLDTPQPVDTLFSRDPITEATLTTTNVALILADTGTPDVPADEPPYDRMSFQFDGDHPGYEIKYVPGPVQSCASGQDEDISGNVFLEIRFDPAVAHDEAGAATVSPTDLQSNLPSIQEAKQTCDFEGVVTWVLGLTAETDFRAFTVADQILVVDVRHP